MDHGELVDDAFRWLLSNCSTGNDYVSESSWEIEKWLATVDSDRQMKLAACAALPISSSNEECLIRKEEANRRISACGMFIVLIVYFSDSIIV